MLPKSVKYLLTMACVHVFFSLCAPALTAQTARFHWDAAAKKADRVVLLDSTHVSVTPNGSGTFIIRQVIKIQTEKGALAHRVVTYDYDPLTAFAQFTHIRITKANGREILLDPATACDYAAPATMIFWGARQIMAPIGRLEPGDILDYTIEKKGFTYALLTASEFQEEESRFIPPMRGHFYDIVPFWVSVPTLKKVYTVSVPKEKPLQYEFYQGHCQPSVRFDRDRTTYTFAMNYSLPPLREPNQVDNFDAAPKLMLSSTNQWVDKSLWFHKVNEDYGSFDPIPEAEAKVKELLKGIKDPLQQIATLTHWVADNMRYSGISMGEGEGYTLHNLKMNFTDRCGVCKDKASMLIGLLRIAGFEAYPAMTMAGSRIESIPADHFNHCVVVVKYNGVYMPLDPTWVPFTRELWSSAEQQQNYLPGIPEGSPLLLTPVSHPDNHYLKISAKTALQPDGTLTGVFEISAEGQTDSNVRRPFTTGIQDAVFTALESELLRVSPNAQLIKANPGKNPQNYQQGPFHMSVTFRIPNYATVSGNTIVCTPLIFSNLYANARNYNSLNTTIETRQNGFTVRCSQRVTLDEVLTLPKGYTLQTPDKETPLMGAEAATFTGYRRANKQTVTFHQEVTLFQRVYQASQWDQVRQAVLAYRDYEAQPIVLTK